jgi:hypothetical protein
MMMSNHIIYKLSQKKSIFNKNKALRVHNMKASREIVALILVKIKKESHLH